MYPYRTRFKKEIVAEFLPPAKYDPKKAQKVIILCSGMPGSPSKSSVLEFLSKKGFWVFSFRYRGTWESGGSFLRFSPEKDVLDIIDQLPKGFTEVFGHKKFRVKPDKLFVFGNSFGGPAAILVSRDPRVTKVVATSPVVDQRYHIKHGETHHWTYRFTKEGFGAAYRFTDKDWNKQKNGKFYNPMAYAKEIDGKKIFIIHAQDDKIVPSGPTRKFAKLIGAKLLLLKKGGHGSSGWLTRPALYKKIAKFLRSA